MLVAPPYGAETAIPPRSRAGLPGCTFYEIYTTHSNTPLSVGHTTFRSTSFPAWSEVTAAALP